MTAVTADPNLLHCKNAREGAGMSLQQMQELLRRLDFSLGQGVSLEARSSTDNWRASFAQRRRLHTRLEFERRLFEFTEHSSRLEWQSVAHYRETLLGFWWRLNEELAFNYERPCDDSQCDDACMRDSVLMTISDELRLYGCVRHGSVHHCRGRCNSLAKTKQWTAVCIFSGIEVDKFLSSTRDSKFDGDDHTSKFRYAMSMNEFDTLPDYEYRGSGAASPASAEGQTLRKIGNNTPLSRFHNVVNRRKEETKAALDQRKSWRFGKVVSEITKAAERSLIAIADKVIQDVLFDKETRIVYNTATIDEAHTIARMRLVAYFSKCKTRSELPNLLQAECEFTTPYRCSNLLTIVEDDRMRKAKFTRLCARLWAICHRSPYAKSIAPRNSEPSASLSTRGSTQSRHSVRQTTCLYEQFCLGVLYTMRYGMVVKTCEPDLYLQHEYRFVPCDPRLLVDLPSEDRIDMFGERGRREMIKQTEPVSSSVQYGESSKKHTTDSFLFKNNGTRKVRKARTKRRVTTVGSGSRRIPQLRHAAVAERDVLPPHLHSSLLVVSGAYEKHDITRGRNFLRECLNSLSVQEMESSAHSLRY